MSLRKKISDLAELLESESEVERLAPEPKSLLKAIDAYMEKIKKALEKIQEKKRLQDEFTSLGSLSDDQVNRRLIDIPETRFKAFCAANDIKAGKKSKGKTAREATIGNVLKKLHIIREHAL